MPHRLQVLWSNLNKVKNKVQRFFWTLSGSRFFFFFKPNYALGFSHSKRFCISNWKGQPEFVVNYFKLGTTIVYLFLQMAIVGFEKFQKVKAVFYDSHIFQFFFYSHLAVYRSADVFFFLFLFSPPPLPVLFSPFAFLFSLCFLFLLPKNWIIKSINKNVVFFSIFYPRRLFQIKIAAIKCL